MRCTMTGSTALMAAVLIAAAAVVSSLPHCGIEAIMQNLTERAGHIRGRRDDGARMDPRFKFPSESGAPIAPFCIRDQGLFAAGNSECYIEDVINTYTNGQNWPAATMKLKIATFNNGATGFITAAEATAGAARMQAQFGAGSEVTISHTFETKLDVAEYNSLNSQPIGAAVSVVDDVLSKIALYLNKFSIPDVQFDREFGLWLFVVPFDLVNGGTTGICFPNAGVSEQRSDASLNSILPPKYGGICFTTTSFFLTSGDTNGDFRSSGLTAGHELGHNFGLLHVHQNVPYRGFFGGCNSVSPSSCEADEAIYNTGDFISDTDPLPDMNQVGSSQFSDSTCQPTSSFPTTCGSKSYTNVATTSKNYMSYADEGCQNEFTAQQMARVKCTIDRFFYVKGSVKRVSNGNSRTPSFVPMVRATAVNESQVTVEWAPPMSLLFYDANGARPTTLSPPSTWEYVIERILKVNNVDQAPVSFTVDRFTYTYTDNVGDVSATSVPRYMVYVKDGATDGAKMAHVDLGASTAYTSSASTATVVPAMALLFALLSACAMFI